MKSAAHAASPAKTAVMLISGMPRLAMAMLLAKSPMELPHARNVMPSRLIGMPTSTPIKDREPTCVGGGGGGS